LSFKNKRFDDLFKILNYKVINRYLEYDFFQEEEVSLIQKINCYHLFNLISGTQLNLGKYFQEYNFSYREENRSNVLIPNNRIYNLLLPKMLKHFTNEDDFSNYFDLFEYFIGLYNMDIRLIIDHPIKFAPFGRRFIMYSEEGRYSQINDTLVHKFIKDVNDNKLDFLSVGFFDGSIDRFNNSVNEYKAFLKNVLRY